MLTSLVLMPTANGDLLDLAIAAGRMANYFVKGFRLVDPEFKYCDAAADPGILDVSFDKLTEINMHLDKVIGKEEGFNLYLEELFMKPAYVDSLDTSLSVNKFGKDI